MKNIYHNHLFDSTHKKYINNIAKLKIANIMYTNDKKEIKIVRIIFRNFARFLFHSSLGIV